MPVIYRFDPDERPNPIKFDDDSDSWWGGVGKCAVAVAIAATIAVNTFAASVSYEVRQDYEDVPAGHFAAPTAPPEEDFWRNPVAPVPATLETLGRFPYLPDPEEIPAGSLSPPLAPTEEDFWNNPVAPVPASLGRMYWFENDEWPQAFRLDDDSDSRWGGVQLLEARLAIAQANAASLFSSNIAYELRQDQEEIPAGSLRGQPDEDFWQNSVPPVAASLRTVGAFPYLPDPEEIPAATLGGQPDEDFWINPVAPLPGTIFVPLPLGDRDEVWAPQPPGFLPDEDFWSNPVRPVPWSIAQPLPLGDNDDVWPLSAHFTPDEDYWILTFTPFTPLGFNGGGPPQLQVDDDYWQNPVAPLWASFARFDQFAQDQNDMVPPAGPPFVPEEEVWPLRTQQCIAPEPTIVWWGDNGFGIPIQDEDFWQNPVAPVFWQNLYPQQWIFEFESVAPPLVDEDYWQNPVAPVRASLAWPSPGWDAHEIVPLPVVPAPADEDFVVIARPQSFWRATLFVDPDEIPALRGTADEDYWENQAPPTVASLRVALPLGDPEELPAGSLFGTAEEDYWENPVPPAPASFARADQFAFDQSEIVAIAAEDEYWQNPVRPIAASVWQPLPIFWDAGEILTTAAVPEEDFWENQVAPTPAAIRVQLPLGDPEEIPAHTLRGQPDEDFWANPVAPVPSSLRVALPIGDLDDAPPAAYLHGQPDEDFWANPVFPIQASLWQSLPYFHEEGLIFVPIISNVAELEAASTGPQASLLFASVELVGVTR